MALKRQFILFSGLAAVGLAVSAEASAAPEGALERFEATTRTVDPVDRNASVEREIVVPRLGAVGRTLDVFGERSALILLIGFPGVPNTYDPDAMHAGVFGAEQSTNEFYREASRGQMWLGGIRDPEGDVWGPHEVQTDGCSTLEYYEVSDLALAAAAADGLDVDAYDHRIYVFPPGVDSCPGGGIGGGNQVWVFGIGPQIIWDWVGHEAAHGFGFGHASSYDDCTVAGDPVTMGGACAHNEYGDPTDIMGRRNFQFSSWHMERAGWLSPENVRVVEASARIRLAPLELASDGVQSVRVPRSNGEFFHFEYRRPVGFDAGLEPGLTEGILVRVVADPRQGGNPHLLDMTPETATNDDAALPVGRSFEDGNMRVTVVETTDAYAILDVTLDGIPPDPDVDEGETGESGSSTAGSDETAGDDTGGADGTTSTGGFESTSTGTRGSSSSTSSSTTASADGGGDEVEGSDSDSGADAEGSETSGAVPGGSGEDTAATDPGAPGCGCHAHARPSRDPVTLVLFALVALGIRRRR